MPLGTTGGTGSGGSGIVIDDNHVFATTGERDTYFSSNPAELVAGMFIQVGAVFQKWSGSAWVDVTAVVRGPKGDTGDTGATGPQGPTGTLSAFSVDGGQFTDVYDTFTIDGGSFA